MFSLLPLFFMSLLKWKCSDAKQPEQGMMFDFSKDKAFVGWQESSDVVRTPGMSKAVLVPQKSQLFQRAIFFSLLNPQPNGAGFAGVKYDSKWNLSEGNGIELKARGQGNNTRYKLIIRHKTQDVHSPAFEAIFQAPKDQFETVHVPFDTFKEYYRGKPVNNGTVLDLADIVSFGLQINGGVYMDEKQAGVSSLEIDYIKAV